MKASIGHIADPLSKIINKSFLMGVFPDKLAIAKVCPIFKNGDKCQFTNYRPISVLPSFSKIFEKVVCNRLIAFFESKNILVDNQFGFRKNRSAYMAILEMYDRISLAIDNREYAIGIFIDLSKAFDTINHSIMIRKLEYYGIRGIALDWFNSYLKSRQQYVFFNGVSSSLKPINCGVPQGSILGPMLFILYINDIVNCSNIWKFILFADDTNLFYKNRDLLELEHVVNVELSKLSVWFKANNLSLNAKKTNFILFGCKNISTPLKLILDGAILEQVAYTKFLGVFMDQKLNWNQHINYITGKISRGLGMISRVSRFMPFNVMLTLYYSLIYPYLLYCCIAWGGASATALHKLEVLQNRSLRLITQSPYRSSASPLYKRLNILKLSDIYRLQISMFMFRVRESQLPSSCMRYCPLNSHSHYGMRVINMFVMPAFRTNIRERCISVTGPRTWNSLPVAFKSSVSLFAHKNAVHKYFISLY
jgi:hypothetical protein